MTLTPADIAQLDQAHAAGNTDLDQLIRQVAALIRRRGVTIGTAAFTAELQTDGDPVYLAAIAALAISRLAQRTEDPTAPAVANADGRTGSGAGDSMGGTATGDLDGRDG